jgi:hypothetical protein
MKSPYRYDHVVFFVNISLFLFSILLLVFKVFVYFKLLTSHSISSFIVVFVNIPDRFYSGPMPPKFCRHNSSSSSSPSPSSPTSHPPLSTCHQEPTIFADPGTISAQTVDAEASSMDKGNHGSRRARNGNANRRQQSVCRGSLRND